MLIVTLDPALAWQLAHTDHRLIQAPVSCRPRSGPRDRSRPDRQTLGLGDPLAIHAQRYASTHAPTYLRERGAACPPRSDLVTDAIVAVARVERVTTNPALDLVGDWYRRQQAGEQWHGWVLANLVTLASPVAVGTDGGGRLLWKPSDALRNAIAAAGGWPAALGDRDRARPDSGEAA